MLQLTRVPDTFGPLRGRALTRGAGDLPMAVVPDRGLVPPRGTWPYPATVVLGPAQAA